jgi:hypothetical protein
VGSNKVQLVSEDAAVVPDQVFVDRSLGALNPVVSIRFPLQLRIVSTPDPSVTLGLMSLGIIAVGCRLKNKIRKK